MFGGVDNISRLPAKHAVKPKDELRKAEASDHATPDRDGDTFNRVEHDTENDKQREKRRDPRDQPPPEPGHIDVQG